MLQRNHRAFDTFAGRGNLERISRIGRFPGELRHLNAQPVALGARRWVLQWIAFGFANDDLLTTRAASLFEDKVGVSSPALPSLLAEVRFGDVAISALGRQRPTKWTALFWSSPFSSRQQTGEQRLHPKANARRSRRLGFRPMDGEAA